MTDIPALGATLHWIVDFPRTECPTRKFCCPDASRLHLTALGSALGRRRGESVTRRLQLPKSGQNTALVGSLRGSSARHLHFPARFDTPSLQDDLGEQHIQKIWYPHDRLPRCRFFRYQNSCQLFGITLKHTLRHSFGYIMASHTNVRRPWTGSSAEEKLDEISLEDGPEAGTKRKSTRPECLSGPIHEILLILVAAFIGATFLVLLRGMMVITDTVRHSLGTTISATVWMTAGPGWVLFYCRVINLTYLEADF